MTETFPNRTEAAISDLIAGRWHGETTAEWATRVRALVEMAKRDRPGCPARIGDRKRCEREVGHFGRHQWSDR